MQKYVYSFLILLFIFTCGAFAGNVEVRLQIKDTTARAIYIQQQDFTGSIYTDTVFFIPGKTIISQVHIDYPKFIHITTDKAAHLQLLLTPEDTQLEITAAFAQQSFKILAINSSTNELLLQYLFASDELMEKYSRLQQSMSNYPFKDNYTAAIEREHQRSLVQLKKLKDATIKRIKKDNSFLRKYLNYHYELIAFNIQTRYTLRDYDQYIQYFNNDTLLLATELPDIITGLLYNHYIKLRNDSIKYAALDSIEGIINTTRLSAVTTRRMNTGYFALLTDIKAYKRIDKIVSSHTYLPHGSCNIITGNKISLTGKTIAEPHAPTRLSDFKKKYNVVFIWSTDCGHCKRSIESLNELYKQSNNKPVQFYSYTIGNYDSAIVNRLEWRLKSTLNNGWHNPFITNFRINYTPLILVLNAQGIALAQPNDIETLQAILAELLN